MMDKTQQLILSLVKSKLISENDYEAAVQHARDNGYIGKRKYEDGSSLDPDAKETLVLEALYSLSTNKENNDPGVNRPTAQPDSDAAPLKKPASDSLKPGAPVSLTESAAPRPRRERSPMNRDYAEAAALILKSANAPMHYTKITELAIEKGYLTSNSRTPEASMSSALSTHARNGERFIRVDKGVYKLRPEEPAKRGKTHPNQPFSPLPLSESPNSGSPSPVISRVDDKASRAAGAPGVVCVDAALSPVSPLAPSPATSPINSTAPDTVTPVVRRVSFAAFPTAATANFTFSTPSPTGDYCYVPLHTPASPYAGNHLYTGSAGLCNALPSLLSSSPLSCNESMPPSPNRDTPRLYRH